MPTEVDTTITVNFTFGDSTPQPVAAADELVPEPDAFDPAESAGPGVMPVKFVRISGGVLSSMKLGGNQPHYPQEARKERISGSVMLAVVIGPDGRMQKVEAVSGPRELRDASVKAVESWYYKPYSINGQPVAVNSTVVVNYSIGR